MIPMRSDITIASSRLWVDVDEGLARGAVEVLELDLEQLAQPIVDGGQRLVEEQDVGIGGQGAGQRHPLALTARALGD